MSRPNGRRKRAIEGLAAALQECFDASMEAAEKRIENWFEPRFEKIETHLDKQDHTLRKPGRMRIDHGVAGRPRDS